MASRKRKPTHQLYDHNAKSNSARRFTQVGNSYVIHSSNVTTYDENNLTEPDMWASSSMDIGQEDYNSSNVSLQENGDVPPNPDSAESLGIKVKAKKRYQNTVH